MAAGPLSYADIRVTVDAIDAQTRALIGERALAEHDDQPWRVRAITEQLDAMRAARTKLVHLAREVESEVGT